MASNNITKVNYITASLLFSCLWAVSLSSIAQTKPVKLAVKDTSKNSVSEEIDVVRSYKPVLADAVKIRRSPNLNDTKPFNPKMTYTLLDKRLELNSAIRELEAQKLAKEIETQRQNNFAKIGLGNLGTNLAQLNLATGQDEALQAGFNFSHLGMSGKLNQQKINTQDFSGYGRSIGDHLVLEGKLGYNRVGTYFFGIDPAASFNNLNPEKQKFNNIDAEGLLFNRADADDESSLTYASKINASIFNNAFAAKENTVVLSGGLGKDLNKFHLGVNALVDITTSKDSSYNFKNNLFALNPYIKLQFNSFKVTGGINYVNEFGSNQRIHIFPVASLDFMLVKNYLTIFGHFGGDVEKTRIKDLAAINPYLNQDIVLKNTVNKLDVSGGLRGTFAPNIGYKAMVSYQTVSDLSYYINNVDEPQKFDVAYFNGNTNIIGFNAELNVNFSDKFNVDSRLDIKQYDNNTEIEAWLRPGFLLTSTTSFKIVDKVKISGDLLFQGDTRAKILSYDSVLPTPNIVSTTQTLKAFADISVGAEYQYNKQISAFFRVNNILANEYQRFPYYNNYGINILGGVSYGF